MVSVIIVNHNYGSYIAQAIDSVLDQTVQDFEIIIIDGDSSDNSRDVIHGYVKKYPHLITAVVKPTSGQAAALNIGYHLSKGDILAFLDSDDYWYENKLETIIEQHETFNAIAHSFSVNGTAVEYDEHEIRFMNESGKFLRSHGICMTFGAITSALSIRREIGQYIFPIPEDEYITYADSFMITSITYFDHLAFIPDVLTFQRIHDSNASIPAREHNRQFYADLFNQNTRLLNDRLKSAGLPVIPRLTSELYRDFLREVNFPIFDKGSCIIWGAGISGMHIKQVIEQYGAKVLFFCDSSSAKNGNILDGVPILSPEELKIRRNEAGIIYVASQLYSHQICKSLQDMGFTEGEDYIDLRLKYYPPPKNI